MSIDVMNIKESNEWWRHDLLIKVSSLQTILVIKSVRCLEQFITIDVLIIISYNINEL